MPLAEDTPEIKAKIALVKKCRTNLSTEKSLFLKNKIMSSI